MGQPYLAREMIGLPSMNNDGSKRALTAFKKNIWTSVDGGQSMVQDTACKVSTTGAISGKPSQSRLQVQ
jgi:hypothetical protein